MSSRVKSAPSGEQSSHGYGREWFIVGIFLLAYTLSFVDRQILTLMVEPIKRDFGLSDTQFGLLHGFAFAIFYTFLGLPIGWLVDRRRRVAIISISVVSWSAMTAACGLAGNYWQLFAARMGVGVGEAGLSPAVYSMMSDLFPKKKLATALSVYSVGIAAGSGLALLLGAYIIDVAEYVQSMNLPYISGLASWQVVFLLVGAPGLPLGLFILRIREPARRDLLAGKANLGEVLRFIGARKRFFCCFLLGLALATALGHGVLGWAPAYFMRIHGWTPEQVGLIYGAGVLLGGGGGMLFGGKLTEILQARGHNTAPVITAMVGVALCCPLGIAAPLSSSVTSALILFSALQFAYMMPWGVVAAAIQMVAPNQMRGQLSALYLFTINLVGLGLGPTLVGMLSDGVYGGEGGVGLSLATAAAVLSPVAVLLLALALRPYRQALKAAAAWATD